MIELSVSQIEKAERLLGHIPGASNKAFVRAINRSADAARTEAARKVREKYYIKHGEVLSTIKIHGASTNDLSATVLSRDTRRELINFRVSPKSGSPGKRPTALRVAVKKDGVKNLPQAFVAKGTSTGKTHVLQRVGKTRYPIHIKYGPAVPEMIGTPDVVKYVEQKALETLDKRLDHEINRVLEGQ